MDLTGYGGMASLFFQSKTGPATQSLSLCIILSQNGKNFKGLWITFQNLACIKE